MMILTIRTDKPEAELGLYNDDKQIAYATWQAHRQLAETIHLQIKALLDAHDADLQNLGGLVVYQGPGSFTGLRIGITVANALADSLQIPIVGSQSEVWITIGLKALDEGRNDKLVVPEYGALPNVSTPKQ